MSGGQQKPNNQIKLTNAIVGTHSIEDEEERNTVYVPVSRGNGTSGRQLVYIQYLIDQGYNVKFYVPGEE